MSKRIKKLICMVMAIAAFFVVEPVNSFNLGITRVYASSYTLNNLQLETPGGSNINLYENDNYTRELDDSRDLEKTYYAKLSSDTSKVVFNTSGFDGIVKIFKSSSSKVYDDGEGIPVLTGKTTFYIRLYDTYDEGNTNECKKEYKVIIKKYTSEEEKEIKNDNQDDIYLQTIELDYGDIPLSFDRQKPTYNVKVDADVKSIAIKAQPEDGATTVKINNITLDENDDYKKMVNLDKGDNKIEISLSQDDEEKRVYTLNINRTESSDTVTENQNTNAGTDATNITNTNSENKVEETNKNENNVSDTKVANKWIKVLDDWQYNDSFGNAIKNTWFYDSAYQKNYYFDNDGKMKTGWLNLNNEWYYLGDDGGMQTGWKYLHGEWYYLDYDGKMKTGWFKDSDGKYYYLYESSGVMAHDTTIGGYKLGSNGAWKK